jgi:hypothetical protein
MSASAENTSLEAIQMALNLYIVDCKSRIWDGAGASLNTELIALQDTTAQPSKVPIKSLQSCASFQATNKSLRLRAKSRPRIRYLRTAGASYLERVAATGSAGVVARWISALTRGGWPLRSTLMERSSSGVRCFASSVARLLTASPPSSLFRP